MAVELNESRMELDQVNRVFEQAESRGIYLRQQVDLLSQKNESLERSLRDMEKWKRQAEDLETQNSVLAKRLEGTVHQLKEVQSKKDEALEQLSRTMDQLDEFKIITQQTTTLLEASRSEVDSLRSQLEHSTMQFGSRLSKFEKDLEATQTELHIAKNRVHEFELEATKWENERDGWSAQQRQLMRVQHSLKSQLDEMSRNSEHKIERQKTIISNFQVITYRQYDIYVCM